ncbi:YqgE/AlgH family protein [Marinovum sp.]|uniref:YqgE/AlgH family protein n=1 Tax=Marinovum sp. TaxID=2024839 RepID=UPI002B27A5D2|nr:YqgE/AlgH family protein [Marinovum sp.]
MTTADDSGLTGQLLIAMPGMLDPRFAHSVVYLCAHSPEGAMGLILNKPVADLGLGELLEQLEVPVTDDFRRAPMHFGGPVEQGRGFVLHTPDYESPVATLKVDAAVSMTATMDILEEIGAGRGPRRRLVALGYAGWGPGQLEMELGQNGWLTCEADAALIFDRPDAEKWEAALGVLGVDALALSATAGHA